MRFRTDKDLAKNSSFSTPSYPFAALATTFKTQDKFETYKLQG
jgi:hypothetical protein